jgi:uncharacterized cupredoxin-like copper-binding protein
MRHPPLGGVPRNWRAQMETANMTSRSAKIGTLLAAAVLVIAAPPLQADETINVDLIDHGMESMKIDLSTEQVKAGAVTFNVTNKSESLVHELLVAKYDKPVETLPYNHDENEMTEDAVTVEDDIEDIDPGKSGTLTVKLEPGTYVLLCNKPGHFKAGMVHTLTVTQ